MMNNFRNGVLLFFLSFNSLSTSSFIFECDSFNKNRPSFFDKSADALYHDHAVSSRFHGLSETKQQTTRQIHSYSRISCGKSNNSKKVTPLLSSLNHEKDVCRHPKNNESCEDIERTFSDSDHLHAPTETTIMDAFLQPDPGCDADQMSPSSLAYIGDSVFELFVRSRYVWPSRRTSDLQNKVVGIVRAETQAWMLSKLVGGEEASSSLSTAPITLSTKEMSVLNRGRNAGGSGSRKRNRGPKRFFGEDGTLSGGARVYSDSTAFECLLGYLYIKDKSRCHEIFGWIQEQLDDIDNES